MPGRATTGLTNRQPWRWRLGGVGALLVLVVALGACSEQKHYNVLSFFFDGVPDPNAPPELRPTGRYAFARDAASGGSVHAPFAQQDCNTCHVTKRDVFFVTDKVDESICLTCHAGVERQYPVMHGPVAAGACSWCHNPHTAPNPVLLKQTAPQVCIQCHDPVDLSAPPEEHLDPQANCLTCHTGHGSEHRFLLRPGVTAIRNRALDAGSAPAGEGAR
jgi:predicted CXXCH cytochrome family protein